MKRDPLGPLADELFARIMPRVLAALSSTGDHSSAGPLPAGVSRRTFNERCASGRVVGAKKVGRSWQCSKAAWLASGNGPRVAAPSCEDADEAAADAFLAASGLRPTR